MQPWTGLCQSMSRQVDWHDGQFTFKPMILWLYIEKEHSNVDSLSKGMVNNICIQNERKDEDLSIKDLNPYENEALIYYFTNMKHSSGLSKKNV